MDAKSKKADLLKQMKEIQQELQKIEAVDNKANDKLYQKFVKALKPEIDRVRDLSKFKQEFKVKIEFECEVEAEFKYFDTEISDCDGACYVVPKGKHSILEYLLDDFEFGYQEEVDIINISPEFKIYIKDRKKAVDNLQKEANKIAKKMELEGHCFDDFMRKIEESLF